jgi:hypothetical protein
MLYTVAAGKSKQEKWGCGKLFFEQYGVYIGAAQAYKGAIETRTWRAV